MKRIGCTNTLACRVLCAAAGLALAGSLATAQTSTARTAEAKSSQQVTAVSPERSLSDRVEGFVASSNPVIADFVGIDGSFCPPGSTPEGETCGAAPVVPDTFNGGCNADAANPPLTPISVGEVICAQTLRVDGTRDTDWYVVTIPAAGNYVVEVLSDNENVVGGIIGDAVGPLVNPDCASIAQINPVVVGSGTTPPTALQAGTYWLFGSVLLGAAGDPDIPCFEYTIRIVEESAFFGACCQPFSVCTDTTADDCTLLGGVFQGVGTDCATTTCPEILPPDNNECDSAQVITAAEVNGADIAGTNLGASAAFGLPQCGGPLSGPAVWYVYDATTLGFQTVTVSTCNTVNLDPADANPDTVLNVFTNNIPDFCLGTFCCRGGNDDQGDPECGTYSEVSFCADPALDGGQYFIVVSGFEGAVGDFLLTVTGDGVACDTSLCIECQPGDVLEGEPCPNDPDQFNGGCNSVPEIFSSLALNQTVCGTAQASGGTRDTDWYEIVITEAGDYEVAFEAGFEGVAGFIGATAGVPLVNPTCAEIAVIAVLTTPAPCEEGIATATLEPGFYWIFAGPLDFEGVSCPDAAGCPGNGRYRLTVRPAADVIPCPVDCPAGAATECEDCADQEPPVVASDCCVANGTPGCDDPTCEATVCALDAFCCDTEWDGLCADLAADNCGDLCDGEAVDDCNGGCNNEIEPSFDSIACGDTVCGTITAGFGLRDTDWYLVEVTNPAGAVLTATLEAAFNGVVFFVDVTDCAAPVVLGEAGFSACVDGIGTPTPAVASVGQGTFAVFVSSGDTAGPIFEGITCAVNADYTLTVEGDCGGVVCPCVADLDGNCIVDTVDLGILLGDFGCSGAGCVGDIDGSGTVDTVDLGILLGDFGCAG